MPNAKSLFSLLLFATSTLWQCQAHAGNKKCERTLIDAKANPSIQIAFLRMRTFESFVDDSGKIRREVTQEIRKLLPHLSAEDLIEAVHSLASLKTLYTIPEFETLLHSSPYSVQQAILETIKLDQARDQVKAIERLIADERTSHAAINDALKVLVAFKSISSAPTIRSLLLQASPEDKASALLALGALQLPSDLTIIKPYYQPLNHRHVREAAFIAASMYRDPNIVPLLENHIQNSPYFERFNAIARAILAYRYRRLQYHRLYAEIADPKSFFDKTLPLPTARFEKTGSETYLLGGKLAGKVILRAIDKASAEAWNKIHPHFNVEPIVSREEVFGQFGLTIEDKQQLNILEKKISDRFSQYKIVYSRVLGPALSTYHWLNPLGDITALAKQGSKIAERILSKFRIAHGHVHNENLLIEETPQGPKVFLIDFDLAHEDQ